MRPVKQAIYSSRTADKFVVRLPDGMRERIAEVAKTTHRSMNSEIVARLEASLPKETEQPVQGVALTMPQLCKQEQELLIAFRKLSMRKQMALIAVITQDDV